MNRQRRAALVRIAQMAGLAALPYIPLLLLAAGPGPAEPPPSLPNPSLTSRSPDPGVSLKTPGGAGHSPGLSGGRAGAGPGPEEIFERSRGWEVKKLESPHWKLILTEHYALRGDAPLSVLRPLGVHAELTFDALQAALGGDASDLRLSVRIFSAERDFRVAASMVGAEGAGSFYDPAQAEAVVRWNRSRPIEAAIGLLRHEIVHLYMDRVLERREPLWLCEGIAEWVEHAAWSRGRLLPGADRPDRSQALRKSLESGALPPLRKLLKAGRTEFYAPETAAARYAESWSLVRLIAGRPEELRALASGAALGNLDDLERRWRASIVASK